MLFLLNTDAEDFEPPVPVPVTATAIVSDKWEGEDEDEPVKVSDTKMLMISRVHLYFLRNSRTL